jgi:hypothetical protein
MRTDPTVPIVELDYSERQRIVVVPDEVLDPPPPAPTPTHDELEPGAAGRMLARTRQRIPWMDPHRHEVSAVQQRTLRAIDELRAEDILLIPMAVSIARREFRFPVGHPLGNVVYLGNPADRLRYYPAADFHRQVFEHKFAEAMRLVMALGATHMRVRWERGWHKELESDLEAPLKKIAKAGGKLEASARRETELIFEANLAPNDPVIPHDLVWYHEEPTWRALAEGRMQRGLDSFELHVRSNDDYGIDSDFEAKIRRFKALKVGGRFTAHRETSWRIEGEFAPYKRRFGQRR